MSPVMIILSFSRADPWLWGTSPEHEISGVLVGLQVLELEVESLFCPASSASAIKIVQKPTNFCMIFMDMKKVLVTCLSLNNPKGCFRLRTNSLLQFVSFFNILLQPSQSSLHTCRSPTE